ncbi:MAG: polymer-forming cytoskeletal protein [Candidatus Binatia bacterium]
MFRKQQTNPRPSASGGESAATDAPAAPAPLVAPAPSIRTSLGSDTIVSGRLSFSEPTRIEGTLRGEVRASDLLVVGETAIVEGVVRALTLIVLGEVRGEVRGAERVEIGLGGRLSGKVEAQCLIVKEGGFLNADCRVIPTRTTVHTLRPASERAADSQR